MVKQPDDLLWKNISSLPYFRGFLRAVEGRYYEDIDLAKPILDLGIGDGHFTATTLPGQVKVGIDPSFGSLVEAQKRNAAEILICCSGDSLPFHGKKFSTVVSNSVLEHIKNLKPVFEEVSRILVDEGSFIICVPNDNFTQNLSVGRMLGKLRLNNLQILYQKVFNKISRHFHPDPVEIWCKKLENAGFSIIKSWNYFSSRSLHILEWGHLFGIPSWINKKLFGRWILIPKMWNLKPLYSWLNQYFLQDQTTPDGAYSFFIMVKE